MGGFAALKSREDGQGCAAEAKPKQGDADDHEGKVVELRHREQAGEVDLESERGSGEQEQAEPDTPGCVLIEAEATGDGVIVDILG